MTGNTIKPVPTDEWDDRLKPVIDDMNGKPINVHGLMAHNPALLTAWWNFRNYSVNGGSIGNRLAELVILRVGVTLGAWYEWGSHVDRSLKHGLTLDEINRVAVRNISSDWSEKEAALLTGVDELLDQQALSEPTKILLAAHFTTAQVMDIISIHGMYITLGCMIKTWGLELDDDVAQRIEPYASEEKFEEAATKFNQDSTRT